MDPKTHHQILSIQKNEITEYFIYSFLAKRIQDPHNKKIIATIAEDERKHYEFWKSITKIEVKPNQWLIFWYILIIRVFGFSFGLKLMERGEVLITKVYEDLKGRFSESTLIMAEEQKHEKELLDILREERIEYAGSMVLGLNDALVELTGALTGLTFALSNGKIIAVTGLITGVAAAMSMAVSEYLASKEEVDQMEKKRPVTSAVYTGVAYLITVFLLVLPYFIFQNLYLALGMMLVVSILIIFGYTFYISVAKSLRLWPRFIEMATISLVVATISFAVGLTLKRITGIEI